MGVIRYDEHAEFQIARRGIEKSWIIEALDQPDAVELSGRRHRP